MRDMNQIVGTHSILFITLDTLRYDVARDLLAQGCTPNLAAVLPEGGWEERHSPGNFTYAAHHAFFAGFLPTPSTPGVHPRPFALRFEGSTTTTDRSCLLDGWSPELGVTNPTENQVAIAQQILAKTPKNQRLLLFINISALHQPNYFYLPGATTDTIESHAAALEYCERQLAKLWNALRQRAETVCILCSDHGTTYGEDGYTCPAIASTLSA